MSSVRTHLTLTPCLPLTVLGPSLELLLHYNLRKCSSCVPPSISCLSSLHQVALQCLHFLGKTDFSFQSYYEYHD